MNNEILTNLKKIYKPKNTYYGSWTFSPTILDKIAKINKGKNAFISFIERYYYLEVDVIFKDKELVRNFEYSISSDVIQEKRSLYFSKETFLENFISNMEELLNQDGETAYTTIKREIRKRKDMYRDFLSLKEESKYYDEIKREYISCSLDISLEEFAELCKKKYTKLLSGYNTAIHFFEKEIDVTKFISCFNEIQFYLYTIYILLKENRKSLELYGKVDFTLTFVEEFKKLMEEIRKKEEFFNTYIEIETGIKYTIDDAIKEYSKLREDAKK